MELITVLFPLRMVQRNQSREILGIWRKMAISSIVGILLLMVPVLTICLVLPVLQKVLHFMPNGH